MQFFLNTFKPTSSGSSVNSSSSASTPKGESSIVILAEKDINLALSALDNEDDGTAIRICAEVYASALASALSNVPDTQIIKDKIFEVGLQCALAGNTKTAVSILCIANSPDEAWMQAMVGLDYHNEAAICIPAIKSSSRKSPRLISLLETAVATRPHLKCTAYFLGEIHEKGLYGAEVDEQKAKTYFDIAVDRGYLPRDLPKTQTKKEYVLMLQAQQSTKSPFVSVPTDIINRIARMRFEATMNNQPQKGVDLKDIII